MEEKYEKILQNFEQNKEFTNRLVHDFKPYGLQADIAEYHDIFFEWTEISLQI